MTQMLSCTVVRAPIPGESLGGRPTESAETPAGRPACGVLPHVAASQSSSVQPQSSEGESSSDDWRVEVLRSVEYIILEIILVVTGRIFLM
jgi:hypothetical protein